MFTPVPSRHYPIRRLIGVQIAATGAYVPEIVVTNEQLRESCGVDPDWILQRTGIRERRHTPPDEATSDLATRAARQCLERAGVSTDEVDLVIVGTFTPDLLCPSTACLVQQNLGLRCGAFDLQAACAGFMYALITGMQFVAAGTSRRCLVIGADCNSRILNPKDGRMFPLFGDGAGAVLLTPGDADQGFAAYSLGSDGAGCDVLYRPVGGSKRPFSPAEATTDRHYLLMDGKPVFKWAVRLVEDGIREISAAAGLKPEELDLFILHQANERIVNAIADALNLDPARLVKQMHRYGNTSAASIPLALDECVQSGRVTRGDSILMSGFGAGLAWGTGVWRW
jgi:3-oxoacyl-[acyl-carrier-protein] synthase III